VHAILAQEFVHRALLDPKDARNKIDHERLRIHVLGLEGGLLEGRIKDNVEFLVTDGESCDGQMVPREELAEVVDLVVQQTKEVADYWEPGLDEGWFGRIMRW
jgi:hypothetical protein